MRDAAGGAMNLYIIVVFIVFALGYMAFNVNYTKAFRMKDKVISIYEKYKGQCSSECEAEIIQYAKKIGYEPEPGSLRCGSGTDQNYYCITAKEAGGSTGGIKDRNLRCYYHITTRVNVNIPIIENLLHLKVLDVTGDTKTIELPNGVNSC